MPGQPEPPSLADPAYFVDGKNGNDANPGTLDKPWKTIEKANKTVAAGDTVYIRGGEYTCTTLHHRHLCPSNSGTPSAWITFRNYPGEEPRFKGEYGTRMWGLALSQVCYIRVEGLSFSDYTDYTIGAGSHHIEIKGCTFQNETSPYRRGCFNMWEGCVGGQQYTCPVHDIWVHGCTFLRLEAGGGVRPGTNFISEGGDAIRIGLPCSEEGERGGNRNITLENNYMAYAGHAVMDSYGEYCVFKNNVGHNEPWYPADNGGLTPNHPSQYSNSKYNGLYSHRVFQLTDTYNRDRTFNLLEGNRLGHTGVNPNNDGATCRAIASSGNIVRYNTLYNAMHNLMKCKYGDNYSWQTSGGCRNMIYNNTLYKSGYGYPLWEAGTPVFKRLYGFRYYADDDEPGNVFMNNIVYDSYSVKRNLGDIQENKSDPPSIEYNNWTTVDGNGSVGYGDPQFVNPDLSQTTSKTLPDLRLKKNSPLIDQGVHQTKVKAVINSRRIEVDNPYFFRDGTWGAEMTHGVTLFPDWIALGNVSNTVVISSIDYENGIIDLGTAPRTPVKAGDFVWLYRNSSGDVVIRGSAPDIGAHEY